MLERLKRGRIVSVFIAVNIVVLLANGVFLYKNLGGSPASMAAQYPLLSNRIFAENQSDIIINFISLRQELREYMRPLGDSLGVYFEYLPSGVSIGINDRKETRLASLAKVPTVMAAYHMIYEGKLAKDKQLTIEDKYRDKTFGSLWRSTSNTVTVRKAAKMAITESDNTAHNVLLANVPIAEINAVYDSLDIPFDEENGYPIISAKSYSSILRSLFLSSYLPKEYSNEILDIMTQTVYTDKIPAKLPAHIPVAHKIGVFERQVASTSTFSDCGIIYVPNRPFLLCMMANGEHASVRQHMSEVSKIIYDYVSSVDGRTGVPR